MGNATFNLRVPSETRRENQRIVTGQGITQVDLTGLGSGIYLLDLLLDGAPTAQTKLVVQ